LGLILKLKDMKKRLFIYLSILLVISSCDPGESLEYKIENNTNLDIKIYFVSEFIYPDLTDNAKVESIPSMNSFIDNSGSTPGLGQAIFSFVEHDSIYITNSSDEILKIFKEDTNGKNIYNIDEYWSVSETPKNHFVYTYEITEEDLE
jgi:hypothetical protein